MTVVSKLGYGSVIGRYAHSILDMTDEGSEPDLRPIAGARVTITPSIKVSKWLGNDGSEPVTIGFNIMVCSTDENGYVLNPITNEQGITLIATDEELLSPPVMYYTVSVTAENIPFQEYRITVPAGQVVDLTTAVPVPSNPVNAVAEWSRVRGEVIQARDEVVQIVGEIPDLVTTAVDELAGPLIAAYVEAQAAPLATYTYTGNTEITVTSVDAGTGVFTKAGHGLVTGDYVIPRANSTTTELPFMVFPGGFHDGQYGAYHVTRLDADTFVLRKSSTDANPMTFTSSGDPSKWHLEKGNTAAVNITGLPPLTRARMVITGGANHLPFLRVAPTGQDGWGVTSAVWLAATGVPVAATGYVGANNVITMRVEAVLDGTGDTPFISANGWAWGANPADATKAVLTKVDLGYKRITALADPSFTGVYVAAFSRRLANGFKVEVFAV